jgi:hypothetical protein
MAAPHNITRFQMIEHAGGIGFLADGTVRGAEELVFIKELEHALIEGTGQRHLPVKMLAAEGGVSGETRAQVWGGGDYRHESCWRIAHHDSGFRAGVAQEIAMTSGACHLPSACGTAEAVP